MSTLELSKTEVFFRDKVVPFKEANLSIASSPILYGLSIYTVFSANWNGEQQKLYIFRLKDHYQRLVNSARIMDFNKFAQQWFYRKFKTTMLDLLKRNEVAEDVLVRVTVFIDELAAGTKIAGLNNSLSAYVYPLGEILPRQGVHVCLSSWARNSDNAIPSRAKINGSYINSALAKNEALLNGYDDTIVLDAQNHVSESSVANVFIVRDGMLITPSQTSDILEGITRSSILAIGKDLGIPTQERAVDRSELYICDEAFLCGSSVRITPILSVDKRPISETIGSLTKKLLDEYEATQKGKLKKYKEWLLLS